MKRLNPGIRIWMVLWMLMALIAAPGALAQEAETPVVITTDVEELVVAVGRQVDYKLSITPKEARRAGYTFTISDPSVATVNNRGLVKGVALGSCTLTIASDYDPSVTKTLPVTVIKPVRRIAGTISQDVLHVGETAVITPTYTPGDASLQQADYSSSREEVAAVDANGVVTGVGRGWAAITLRSRDGFAKAQVKVRVLQQPESVQVTSPADKLTAGKRYTLKAEVLPKNADNKKVTWTSSDENVATINAQGRVSALNPGEVTFTAQSADAPSVEGGVTLRVVRLAKSVAFSQKAYDVIIGQSAPTSVTVGPEDATDKTVTYKSSKPKIVSVDENGVVTAIAPGKAVITATTADGSRRQARTTVNVIVPVTGVSFKHSNIRVGANNSGTFTADIQPKTATNKHMTWTSSDERIAKVSGNTNRVRVSGRRWGRCQIFGVTEDGGFTCSVYVNVGSLSGAVTVYDVHIENGWPYVALVNNSNMHITRVSFEITGTNEMAVPVEISTRNGTTLYGSYDYGLAPGARTDWRRVRLPHAMQCHELESLSAAVTGWETDTGFYGSDGLIYYSHSIPENSRIWNNYMSDKFLSHQNEVPR